MGGSSSKEPTDEKYHHCVGNNIVIDKHLALFTGGKENEVDITCINNRKLGPGKWTIKLKARGFGVIKIGLSEKDPTLSSVATVIKLVEFEDAFEASKHKYKRVLSVDALNTFTYSDGTQNLQTYSLGTDKPVWLFVMIVYGDVAISVKDEQKVICPWSEVRGNKIAVNHIEITLDQTAHRKDGFLILDQPIQPMHTYILTWDIMEENIKNYGFFRFGLTTIDPKSLTSDDLAEKFSVGAGSTNLESDVQKFPSLHSCPIDIRQYNDEFLIYIDKDRKLIHNVTLNSKNTTFDIPDMTQPLYLIIEMYSGRLHVKKSPLSFQILDPKTSVKQFYLFENIQKNMDADRLKLELEHKFGQKPFQVYYGTNPFKAVVIFRSKIGQVKTMNTGLIAKPVLEPQTLQVLPKPNESFQTGTKDFYEQYFCNHDASGGGPINRIRIEGDYLLVTFKFVEEHSQVAYESPSIPCEDFVLKIFDARSVYTRDHEVDVIPYFESLGLAINRGQRPEIKEESTQSNPVDVAKLRYLQGKKENETREHMTRSAEASVDWPDLESQTQGTCTVLLKPTFRHDTQCAYEKLLGWKTKAVRALDDLVKTVMKEILPIKGDKWVEIRDAMTDLQKDIDLVVLEDEMENTVTLLTMSRTILVSAKRNVDEICDARVVPMAKKDLKFENKEKFEALKKLGIMETFEKKFKSTRFTYSNDQVIIKGPETEVNEACIEIWKSFSDLKNVEEQIDWKKANLLSEKGVRDKVDEMVRQKTPEIVPWYLTENESVIIYTRNKEGFSGLGILLSCINELLVQEIILLDKEDVNVVTGHKEWKSFLDDLFKSNKPAYFKVHTDTERSVIELTGFTDAVKNAKEKISEFLQKQSKEELLVRMTHFTTEFINTHGRALISKDCKAKVEVYSGSDGKPGGFVIHGTRDQREKGEKNLRALEARVCTKWFHVKQPKLVKISQTHILQHKSRWEKECQCIISIETALTLAESSKPCVAISNDGKMIQLILGDITKLKVDVIVNPANKDLNHDGGLARVIIETGGEEIQNKCMEFIEKNGPLDVSKVFVTGGGRLRCKHIIHAVGPVWLKGQDNEEKKLYDTVQNIFHEAEKLNCRSIAMPSISMGIFAFPPDKGTQQILQAIKDFVTQKGGNSRIEQIYLCDLTEDNILHFCDAMEKIIGSSWFVLQHNLPLCRGGFPYQIALHGNNAKLHVIKDSIENQKVDVIISTTAKWYPHMAGQISQLLIKTGGKSVDDALKKGPKNVNVGDVVLTTGGSLPSKFLFHVLLSQSWDQKSGYKMLEDIMQKCLQMAKDKELKSIAFPTIGTGGCGFPADMVAAAMLKTIQSFNKNPGLGSIQEIVIVLYHKDSYTCTVFDQKVQQHFPELLSSPNKRTVMENPQAQFMKTVIPAREISFQTSTSVDKSKSETVYEKVGARESETPSGGKSAAPPVKNTTPSPLVDDILVVGITSDDKENITKVEEKMKRSIAKEYKEDKLTLKINLTAELEKKIQEFAEEECVEVKTDSTKTVVEIHGFGDYVDKTRIKIDRLAADMEMKEQAAKAHSMLANIINWEEETSTDNWTPFSAEVNFFLEKNFKNNPKGQIEYQDQDKFSFNLGSKTKFDQITRQKTNIRRTDKTQGAELPHTWDIKKTGGEFKEVQLVPASAEYSAVKAKFKNGGCPFTNIIQIIRVENRTLYLQYHLKKQELENRNPKQTQNELNLFHGTSFDTVSKVNQGGYDRNYCGKNAVAFGEGVYFATSSRYSHGYAASDGKGVHRMYVAKVLTGQFTQGAGGMKAPPPNPFFPDGNVLFDSVVDNPATPGMYIIFHDSQAYPEYLVEYQ